MPVVLKIKSGSELYRIVLGEDKCNFEGIQEAIQTIQPERGFVVKYRDDEDELCTLCPSTFPDFSCHASDNDGKKIMKVEVVEDTEMCKKTAYSAASACDAQVPRQNPFAFVMDKGLAMLKTFHKRDFLSQGSRHGHWHAVKSLKITLAQLHRNGLLDATSFAALFLNSLPNIMLLLVEDSEKLNWKCGHLLPKMQGFLEDLQTLLATTEGMEHCAQLVTDWREQKILPSEACLQLLPALSSLPFSSQVKVLEEMYTKMEAGLQGKLQKIENKFPWMPVFPMTHECVTCDGCNVSPIQGLRFKCKTRPNYDLCAGCYTRKNSEQDDVCSAHEFETISFPNCNGFGKLMSIIKGCGKGKGEGKGWKGCCKGKGEGKGKGKGKGEGKGWKGCCKGNSKGCGAEDFQSGCQPVRPCAREGCTFAATWHPTHCCAACEHKGLHGGRCERQVFMTQAEPLDEEKPVEFASEDFEVLESTSVELPFNDVGDAEKGPDVAK